MGGARRGAYRGAVGCRRGSELRALGRTGRWWLVRGTLRSSCPSTSSRGSRDTAHEQGRGGQASPVGVPSAGWFGGALGVQLSQPSKVFSYCRCSCYPGPPPGARVLSEVVCGGPSSEGTQEGRRENTVWTPSGQPHRRPRLGMGVGGDPHQQGHGGSGLCQAVGARRRRRWELGGSHLLLGGQSQHCPSRSHSPGVWALAHHTCLSPFPLGPPRRPRGSRWPIPTPVRLPPRRGAGGDEPSVGTTLLGPKPG